MLGRLPPDRVASLEAAEEPAGLRPVLHIGTEELRWRGSRSAGVASRDLLILVAALTLVALLAARVVTGYLPGDLVAGEPELPAPNLFLVAPDGSLLIFKGTRSDPRFSVWSSETGRDVPMPVPEKVRVELSASRLLPEASVWEDPNHLVIPGCSHSLAPTAATIWLPSGRRETRTSCWRWFRFLLSPLAPTVSLTQKPREHPDLRPPDWAEGLAGSLEGRRVLASGLYFKTKGWMDSKLDLMDTRGGTRRLTRHWPLFVAGLSAWRARLSPDAEFLVYEVHGVRGFGWSKAYVVRRRDGRRWRVGATGNLQWRPGQPHQLYGNRTDGIYSWTLPD